MRDISTENYYSKKNKILSVLFFATLIFQTTALRFLFSIENISRISNILILAIWIMYSINSISKDLYSKKVWYYYLIPGIMITLGMLINFTISVSGNLKLIGAYGLTIPWFAYLAIPGLMNSRVINTKILWRYYYYFMLWINIFGLSEYYLLFAGIMEMRELSTPYAVYLAGYSSLLYLLGDGVAYYRYYGCFLEPGTTSMYLLPAIAYAYYQKKYLGIAVFSVALYLTDSLGGFISFVLLIIVFIYTYVGDITRNRILIPMIISLLIGSLAWFIVGDFLMTKYIGKNLSAEVRVDNVTSTISNFPELIINNITGLRLRGSTGEYLKSKNYYGSNFIVGSYLNYGGALGLFGYISVLWMSFSLSFKSIQLKRLSNESKIVFSSLIVIIPFIVQRTTIWESALFAFLFAPTLIRVLKGDNSLFE